MLILPIALSLQLLVVELLVRRAPADPEPSLACFQLVRTRVPNKVVLVVQQDTPPTALWLGGPQYISYHHQPELLGCRTWLPSIVEC